MTHIRNRNWPIIVQVGSIMMLVMAVVMAIVGVVRLATAESEPELRQDSFVPDAMIDIPGGYRSDGMVLWGKPADIDLAGVTCRVVFTNRERELQVGPRDSDGALARHTDPAHGAVAYLASTATVLGQPSAATCEADGLERVFISADRDVEGQQSSGTFFLIGAAFFLLFGLALRLYLRSLNRSPS